MENVIDVLVAKGVDVIYFFCSEGRIYNRDSRCLGYLTHSGWVLYPKPMGPPFESLKKMINANITGTPNNECVEYRLDDINHVNFFTMLYTTSLK